MKDAKGKLTRISVDDAQKYSAKDLQGLNAALRAGAPKSFVFYEEMTKEVKRDAKGNIIYRMKGGRPILDSKRKKVPLRKTKITYAKAKREQKPVLFTGKKTRALDFGFQKRSKRERPQAKHIVTLATHRKKWSQEIALFGDTLKEACNQIQVPMTLAEFKTKAPDGLGVNGRIKIDMDGDTTIIPFRTTVDVMANFSREVSQSMRYALADHGLRFTSLLALEELALENPEMEEEILTVGRAKRSAVSLMPIFAEFEGAPTIRQTSKKAPRVSVVLSVEPL